MGLFVTPDIGVILQTFIIYKKCLLLIIITINGINNYALAQNLPLIPMPVHLTKGTGSFIITSRTAIIVPQGYFSNEAEQLNQIIGKGLSRRLKITNASAPRAIQLVYNASITAPEAYDLKITNSKITISAGSQAGIFHAIETIRQLLPVGIENRIIYKQLALLVL